MRISNTVGKGAYPRAHDVMVVQAALASIKDKSARPYYAGKADGRPGPKLIAAIAAFQATEKLPATGKIEPSGATMQRLRQRLSPQLRKQLESGVATAAATNPAAMARARQAAERTADTIKRTAPLPKREAEALARIVREAAAIGVPLDLAEVSVDGGGRFQVRLAIPRTALPSDGMAGPQITRAITEKVSRLVAANPSWLMRSPNSLVYYSANYYPGLRTTSSTLTVDMMRRLEMKTPPKCPVARTVAIATAEHMAKQKRTHDLDVVDTMPGVKKELMATMFQASLKERIARLEREVRRAGPRANGCGSDDISRLIPDSPFGFNFKPACDAHDKRYSRLSWTKERADLAFLGDMLAVCNTRIQNSQKNYFDYVATGGCVQLAIMYYAGVSLFAGDAYELAQEKARKNDWK